MSFFLFAVQICLREKSWKVSMKETRAIMRKYRKCCGIIVLFLLLISGLLFAYNACYQAVPSQMRLLTDKEQEIDLDVMASASIETATGKVMANLQKPLIMVTGSKVDTYEMDVRLLGIIPLKKVELEIVEEQKASALGIPVGIFIKTKGVMVVDVGSFRGMDGGLCRPADDVLQEGDYILKYNDIDIQSKKQFTDLVADNKGEMVTLLIERDGDTQVVDITPEPMADGLYKMGIWIRDNAQGVGTLTIVDEEGNFGALGHGIADTDTGLLMGLGHGSLYDTTIVGIRKSADGVPGELTGMIHYDDSNIIGKIEKNTPYGVFGHLNLDKVNELGMDLEYREICLKQDVELGAAQILSGTSGEAALYDVEITAIHLDDSEYSKSLEIQVVDEQLISLTGGIVQGMSGSPILQNGRIVGAVTHVLVNDPTRGYGIFIENMLEH